jgi:hypothetical protein
MGEAAVESCLGSSIELVLPNPIRNKGYPPPWDCEDSSSILVNNLNVEVTFGLRQITPGRFETDEHPRHPQCNAVCCLKAWNIQAARVLQTAKFGPDVNVIARHSSNRVAKEAFLVMRSSVLWRRHQRRRVSSFLISHGGSRRTLEWTSWIVVPVVPQFLLALAVRPDQIVTFAPIERWCIPDLLLGNLGAIALKVLGI